MTYSSIENKMIKNIKKLNNKKYRDQNNLFLVEGEHLVLEAYKSGFIKTLILEETSNFKLDVDTIYVTKNVINYISELDTSQNIMAICEKKSDNKILGNKLLILEDIQDPGNLGTIIRSALAFNIDTIILSTNTVDMYNSKVIRGSQGMLFHINIVTKDLKELIPKLKIDNYKIFGTKVTKAKSLKSIEKISRFAIIMGNEGNGMSDEISRLCDDFIYIDMNPLCESLNVGVATSIILYELDK